MDDENRSSVWKTLTPLISGMVFGVGWWIFISAHIVQAHNSWTPEIWAYYYIPGIVASFALVMTNIVDVKSLNGNSFLAIASPGVSARIRAWLFLSFSLHFGAMIAGIWIMAAIFLPPGGGVEHSWPGIAMMLQTTAIFVSSMILLWSKSVDYKLHVTQQNGGQRFVNTEFFISWKIVNVDDARALRRRVPNNVKTKQCHL